MFLEFPLLPVCFIGFVCYTSSAPIISRTDEYP